VADVAVQFALVGPEARTGCDWFSTKGVIDERIYSIEKWNSEFRDPGQRREQLWHLRTAVLTQQE